MTLTAKLYGLVLSGGQSTRMGTDKSVIVYHTLPQREHLYHILDQVCEKTFISLRDEQQTSLPKTINALIDRNEFKGPHNGLLTAHKNFPEVAWLVLAVDLPLIDLGAVRELIAARNPDKGATAFALRENPLPEPLCAIWEPHALADSIAYLQNGNGTCPRKYLINHPTQLVFPSRENVLLNANSSEDYQNALTKLSGS